MTNEEERDVEIFKNSVKSWKKMGDVGLNLMERAAIRKSYHAENKNEYPFIKWGAEDVDGEEMYFHSTYDMIKSFRFKTKNEVILANSIYLNMDEGCGSNEFIQLFKYTLRILGITNSAWS